jgi:hypothetical protein
MFNNTANGLLFKEKVSPQNGKYYFQVAEFHSTDNKELSIVFTIGVPASLVTWEEKDTLYALRVDNDAFSELQEKAQKYHCEIYIYPQFQVKK